ncbi:peptide chain release factor N(5)-glutamine methyltransferase [Streptococcus sp. DD13]|uniref:peptide chain release factor N(5)-glutamine methyltransferase n=1 Tax=Streptococcus sp. DD13 TaxID=1777881 RepID=UPI000798D9B6|nr:peptide chain release factor N(5)-glutamine methyltransferase [Streptococcus sp. DD13]KXT78808.1 Methylase of polypeptide chain release factor [Streptococcus sp. DD13]
MNYAQALATFQKQLEEIGEEGESLSLLFQQLKAWNKTDLVLHLREEISAEDQILMQTLFERLAHHEPFQYILGYQEFAGLQLHVDSRVLIPRLETEELVSLILKENQALDLQVLDLGTGSGAIALAMAHQKPSWSITASDISSDALQVAQENADRLNLSLQWVQSDLFAHLDGSYDIIVSNPPYISRDDEAEVGLNVFHSEPHLALFAEEDGLALYRRIAEEARDYLKPGGKLYLEIGYKQGETVPDLFRKYFPDKRVRTLKDQFGQDRMVVVDDRQD